MRAKWEIYGDDLLPDVDAPERRLEGEDGGSGNDTDSGAGTGTGTADHAHSSTTTITTAAADATDAYLLVYSVDSRASFSALRRMHAALTNQITTASPYARPFLVVAHKTDLPPADWEVSGEEGAGLARSLVAGGGGSGGDEGNDGCAGGGGSGGGGGVGFVQTSTVTGNGVQEVADEIVGRVLLARFAVDGASLEAPRTYVWKSVFDC